MIYLSRNDLLTINHNQISFYGGRLELENDNILNLSSFEYVLEIIQNDDYFPDIFLKAGAYVYYIIKDHVFVDGCKRTGMFSSLFFLGLNNTLIEITDQEIEAIPLEVERNSLNIVDIAQILKSFKIE